MGIAERVIGCRSQARRFERAEDATLAIRGIGADVVDDQRFHHEIVDRLLGVEGLVRVLEDQLNPAAVCVQGARPPQVRDVISPERQPASRLSGQLDDDTPGRRLAAARLTDEGQDLPAMERQVDPVDGPDYASRTAQQGVYERAPDRELDAQPFDSKQLLGLLAHPSSASIEG